MRHTLRICTVALMFAALATGCGSADEGDAASGTGKNARKALSPEAARLSANMVKAVNAGDRSALIEVRFEVSQRPEVGKPVDISFAFIPTASLDRLSARFQTGDALEVVKGGETEQIAHPVTGTPVMHTLTITPKRDGIFTVMATVLMDSETESVSRNFAIPVIAGSGLPEWASKQAVARTGP
jgi:hypothetical protein